MNLREGLEQLWALWVQLSGWAALRTNPTTLQPCHRQ